MVRLQEILRSQWADLLMLLVSIACFGVFAWRMQEMSRIGKGSSARIAVLQEGIGEKKSAGSLDFARVGVGAGFFNLDSIWVGKGGTATLQIDGGDKLLLAEKTLLIFKRPVRPRKGFQSGEQFKLIVGKVNVFRGLGITEERKAVDDQIREIPKRRDPADSVHDDRSGLTAHPKHHSLLLVRQKPTHEPGDNPEVAFAWPMPFSGFLALRNSGSGTVEYYDVKRSQGVRIAVEVGSQYVWQLVTPAKSVALGPFEFEVRAVDAQSTVEILKHRETGHPIELLW